MKLLFILSILTISASTSFAQNLRYTYHDYSGTKVKEKFSVNSKEQKHGSYTAYASNGKIIAEATFKNGVPDGKQERFIDMNLNNECSKLPYSIKYYDEGERVGTWKEYGCKGGERVLIKLQKYENDEQVYFEHYSDDGSRKIAAGYNYNGKQEKWYPDGQLANVVHLKEGVFEGPFKQYYTNGQIGVDGVKKNGKWFGEKNEWYANGNKKSIENFTDGDDYGEVYLGKQQYFDSLGNKTKEYHYSPIKDFNQTVEVKKFYNNGKLMSEYSMVKEGRKNPQTSLLPDYKDYHENGNIAEKGQLTKDGYKTGIVVRYNSDGSKEGEYEYNNGNKIGEWTIYYDSSWNEVPSKEAAVYIRKATFNNEGRPVEKELVKDYYSNGEKQFEGYLYSTDPDVKSGYCKFYYENGQKQLEGSYNAYTFRGDLYDRPTGKFISYHKNGNVSEKGNYKLFERPDGSVVSYKYGDWFYYNQNGEIDSVQVFEEKQGETSVTKTLNKEQAEERERQRRELEEKKLVEATKVLCDSVTNRVERAYVGTNSLISSLADTKVKKVEKKNLYEGFEQVVEHYKNQISSDNSSLEINEINKRLLLLEKRMLELRSDETKGLEKSIRKANNVQEIIELLKFEDN